MSWIVAWHIFPMLREFDGKTASGAALIADADALHLGQRPQTQSASPGQKFPGLGILKIG